MEQTLKGHLSSVRRIIELKENLLISMSYDKSMRIWKINNEKKIEHFKEVNFQDNISNSNILKLNDKEFVTFSHLDKCLKFWNYQNIEKFKNILIINNIELSWTAKNMIMLEKDILCICGENSKGLYLINICSHQLIKTITRDINSPKCIFAINKCKNGLILCSIIDGKGNNCLVKYKYNELNVYCEKVKAHESNIFSCVDLDDEIICSGGNGKIIKLWKY